MDMTQNCVLQGQNNVGYYVWIYDICLSRDLLYIKGMKHVPNIFMRFDKYLFLKVINILI